MAQKINFLRYNRFEFRRESPFLREQTGPIRLALVGLIADRQTGRLADEIRVNFEIFKIPYNLNYSDFYYV